jgi:ABC-type dipeptide/oligopeptide/nickel transport system permease component
VHWVIRRLIYALITILVETIIVFAIVRSIPGDPVLNMIGVTADQATIDAMRRNLGLDQPIFLQYFYWIGGILVGDWGRSLYTGEPVLGLIRSHFINTLILASAAIFIGGTVGVVSGLIAGLKHNTKIDRVIQGIALGTYSLPTFFTGIVLIFVFAVNLRLLPAFGGGQGATIVLPSLTLALFVLAMISRITRAATLDVLTQDYIITARAKGLSETRIRIHYVFLNTLTVVMTIVGLQFGMLLGGSVITESVFAYPGLGYLMVESVQRTDYPVIQGTILVATIAFVAVNLIVDLANVVVDRRLTKSEAF